MDFFNGTFWFDFVLFIAIIIIFSFNLYSMVIDRRISNQNLMLKEYAEKMRASEERYRSLIEISPDTIAVIQNQRIAYMNPAGLRLLGFAELADVIGKSYMDFISNDNRTEIKSNLDNDQNFKMYIETLICSKDGTDILLELYCDRITYSGEPAILCVGRNVTERKLRDSELHRTRLQLQNMLDSLDTVVWATNADLSLILNCSSGVEKLTGIRAENYVGKSTDVWLDRIEADFDTKEIMIRTKQALRNGHPVILEFPVRHINGEARWVQGRCIPVMNEYGEVDRIEGMVMDITDTKYFESALKESEERYRLLQESLNHFSQDLFRVMKTSDLEDRLIREMKAVLHMENVHIIEIDDRLNLYRSTGGQADFHEVVLQYFIESEIGELVLVPNGFYVKIGEPKGRMILLCVENFEHVSKIMPLKIWLQTIARYACVLYEGLFTIEDLVQELEKLSQDDSKPNWIERLLFQLAEKERMRLSADLHDSVLQNQILWYRKLKAIREGSSETELEADLYEIEQGMHEVIQQIRRTCNNLRPPYLAELGIIKALEGLFSQTQVNDKYIINFDYADFKENYLGEEEMISLYRISQELLANARKHSQANSLEFSISTIGPTIYFSYQDDGVGMELERLVDQFEHIGLSGIRKRVNSIGGELELCSTPGKGFKMFITIPGKQKNQSRMLLEVMK